MIKAWRELVTIPTYEIGKPEKNPIFLEKRVYQGSSGVVYPYPVIESIANSATPHEWQAVWLENEYLKIMILPELGGRIQMAYDKIRERHFVYYNHVIKPALVGLTGPWISGGIEFNWPQHHRPSTYLPVDCDIVENEDGSVTVWVNEMERMFHQKGMAGFTLRPGSAYLEIQGRVSNRTSLPQTFLWWANPAVEVNDDYQSVFPPDVNAVFDHGKRAVSSFPIATGTYYKMDYSAGVDISNYKNIKVPTSYMAVNSKYDFEGGYENDTQAGMLHVASHHLSPGKKQWTWGNGDFGRAWDRNLTDETEHGVFRPYIELMAGVYTENQPDFTWLMPYEEKQFVQYFMPYREVGMVKQASKDFIFNIEEAGNGKVTFRVMATSKQTVRIVLKNNMEDEEYFNQVVTLSPEAVLTETVETNGVSLQNLYFAIDRPEHARQHPLLEWLAEEDDIRPIPDAAESALSPHDTKTTDQLYLTGLHLEQYRHATWSALDYYEEALRRDPNDVRCNMQMGLWYLRRGRFSKAQTYLEKSVKVWKRRNPNPYDGEPLFYLGLTYKMLGQSGRAYDCFWKSAWNKAWADAAYFEAACISMADERWEEALDELERSLISNSCNHKARAMKAVALRKLGRKEDALAWIQESYKTDRFNYVCMVEEHLLTDSQEPLERMVTLMHGNINNYHETALDYIQAQQRDEARLVLQLAIDKCTAQSPLTYFYLGYYCCQGQEAFDYFEKAAHCDEAYCFPNRLEDIPMLQWVSDTIPEDSSSAYYLGCLYYDKRQYDLAISCWERTTERDPQFPTAWRNLALARFNKQGRQQEAVTLMERAFHLNEADSRILMELDQLYKRMQKPHAERLAFLQKYPDLVAQRDDLVLEEITLLNQVGRFEEAMQRLDAHQFHPWEGGEGKVPAQYQFCRVELAKVAMRHKDYPQAVTLLEQCLQYPHHLGEGKLYGAQENDFYYFLGCCYEAMQQTEKAHACWEEATQGPQTPAAAMYYNDAKPDKIFYQGLALQKLGRQGEANGRFYKLVNYGKQHIFEKQTMDYFAVSLPDLLIWEDSMDRKNRIHCLYMLALGYYGLGDAQKAQRYLNDIHDINHQGVQALKSSLRL